ncbi:MAG TPA: glycosyltransferase, partial [Candidatus Limnocylindrales bacterium]|nr:glycosyltransferase [Candidatus Limnocylindrales bacterium]
MRRPDAWYVGEWSRLAKAVFGADVDADLAVDPARARDAVRQALRQRAQAEFGAAIGRGETLERALARSVSDLATLPEYHAAWAMAEGIGRVPEGAEASAIGHAVLLHRRRQLHRAWTIVRELSDEALARSIPVEAVDAALAAGTAEGRRRALAIATSATGMGAAVLVDLAGRLLAFEERRAAAELVTALRRRPPGDLDERRRHALTLIERWLEPSAMSVPAGAVPIGVIGYGSPDPVLTSGNLGDSIQTLALVGNLVRLSNVTFTGDAGLGELATELQGRIPAELRIPDVAGAVHLVGVDRDFSSADAIPPGTWLVAFGWHMHPLFDLRYDFPYHTDIRPVFLSFHVNRLDMLSDEAREYLRRHGPIGCRDWSTVFLLLSAGIDAFFSGCLTMTIDGLYPSREAAYAGSGMVGIIDLPPDAAGRDAQDVRVYSHQSDAIRSMSLTEGLRAADAAMAAYQRDLARAVTGRLHAYLPLTSVGVPVEFRTGSPGDVRFAGLTGFQPGDARLAELRDGIRGLLAPILAKVVGGADEAEVYATWRDLTRDRVAEARARFQAPIEDPPTTIDIDAAVATSMAASRRFGPHEEVDPATITDVVLSFDQNLTLSAAVLVESIVANASGPVRLWVLARGLSGAYQEWLAGAFPALPMTFVPCDGISYGPRGRPRRVPARITVSTMDRLLLPAMLEDVARVVYLDVDMLMLDDICRLAGMDLGGRPVGARDSTVSEASEWQRAGRALAEPLASELRRRMGVRHGYGNPALNAGLLVMDLDRMRRDGFTPTSLGLVERYGLHDQDTMLAYVGPDRAVIEPRWNAMPVLEDVRDPSLIHWASFGKPWEPELTYGQDRWLEYAARL